MTAPTEPASAPAVPSVPAQTSRAVAPGELLTRRERLRLVLVLGAMIALGPLTIDMYLPALPGIAGDLDAGPAAVQLTLTGTLVGLALGQLVIGPVSDALGRRTPLLAGVALHVVASVLCAVAPSVAVLGAFRVLQGFCAAAAAVVAMAVVRDLFTGRAAAVLFSRLMLVLGAAPVLAPTLGGELLRFTAWRGVFLALGVIGVALLAVAVLAMPETLPPAARRSGGPAGTARAYRALLRDRTFVALVLVAGLSLAGLFAYVSGSSFVLQDGYGLDEQAFALVFGAGAVALIAATQLNVRLLDRWAPERILLAALVAGTGFAALLLILALTGTGGLLGVLLPMWAVLGTVGLAIPNVPAIALSRHGEAAGTAAALLGAAQFGVGALASPLVGVLGTDAVAMAVVVLSGTAAATLLLLSLRPWRPGFAAEAGQPERVVTA